MLPPAHRLVFKPGEEPVVSRYWWEGKLDRAEETLLRQRFGAEYEKYAREVPMLVRLP